MATSLALPAMRSCGHTLDEGDDKLGLLTSTYNVFRNMDSARQRMQEDSYLLLRGLLDEVKGGFTPLSLVRSFHFWSTQFTCQSVPS